MYINPMIRARFAKAGAAVAVSMAPAVSFAQSGGLDVSAGVAEIGTAKTAVLAIGAAVFTVMVGIKLYKWVRRAL